MVEPPPRRCPLRSQQLPGTWGLREVSTGRWARQSSGPLGRGCLGSHGAARDGRGEGGERAPRGAPRRPRLASDCARWTAGSHLQVLGLCRDRDANGVPRDTVTRSLGAWSAQKFKSLGRKRRHCQVLERAAPPSIQKSLLDLLMTPAPVSRANSQSSGAVVFAESLAKVETGAGMGPGGGSHRHSGPELRNCKESWFTDRGGWGVGPPADVSALG